MKVLRGLISSVLAFSTAIYPLAASANPTGGQVAAGSAVISGAGTSTVTINQSTSRAIINWQTFNISAGEMTSFKQPDASAVTLNRVTGGLGASTINGIISANGGVYVVNPNGILFGPNAKINVGSFLGTTHDIADGDFMAGKADFTISGNPAASIVNQGSITAADGGFAALVAPGVRNDGIITARLGTVALAAGNAFTLDPYGDGLIKLEPTDAVAADIKDVATGKSLASLVQNTGTLRADGGTVALTAASVKRVVDSVINTSGTVEANSVGTKDGLIVFGAQTAPTKVANSPPQKVKVSGTVSANGADVGTTGGKIQITGEDIALNDATIDASGDAGGGTIVIGGDFKGGAADASAVIDYGQHFETTAVPTATTVALESGTTIDASAGSIGDGGKIVVWADNTTQDSGSLLATGGATAGNGGFAEVSGGQTVDYSGLRANLSAANGTSGTILFDPALDTIDDAKAITLSDTLSSGTDVTDSADTINVDSSIFKVAGGDATLTFNVVQALNIGNNVIIGSTKDKLNIAINIDTNVTQNDIIDVLTQAFGDSLGTFSYSDMENFFGKCQCWWGYQTVPDLLSALEPYLPSQLIQSEQYQKVLNYNYYPWSGSEQDPLASLGYFSNHIEMNSTASIFTNGGTISMSTTPIPTWINTYYQSPIGFEFRYPTSDHCTISALQSCGNTITTYNLQGKPGSLYSASVVDSWAGATFDQTFGSSGEIWDVMWWSPGIGLGDNTGETGVEVTFDYLHQRSLTSLWNPVIPNVSSGPLNISLIPVTPPNTGGSSGGTTSTGGSPGGGSSVWEGASGSSGSSTGTTRPVPIPDLNLVQALGVRAISSGPQYISPAVSESQPDDYDITGEAMMPAPSIELNAQGMASDISSASQDMQSGIGEIQGNASAIASAASSSAEELTVYAVSLATQAATSQFARFMYSLVENLGAGMKGLNVVKTASDPNLPGPLKILIGAMQVLLISVDMLVEGSTGGSATPVVIVVNTAFGGLLEFVQEKMSAVTSSK